MSDVDALPDRLIAKRKNVWIGAGALPAVARVEYYNRKYAAGARTVAELTCPDDPDHLPLPTALATWVAESMTEAALTEAAELLTALVLSDLRDAGAAAGTTITTTELLGNGAEGPPRVTRVPDRMDFAGMWRYLLVVGLTARSMATDDPTLYATLVEQAHRLWCTAGGRHPLAPLVDAWQRRPVPAPWDNRRYANLPGPLVGTRHVAIARELRDGQAALPLDFDVLSAAVPADEPRLEVGYLLTLAPELSLLPLVLLDVFSANASRGRSGPVPVPARIGWEVLVALGGEDRERIGGPALLDCSMMDLYRRVYPSTPRWQDGKGNRLLRGLFDLDAARPRWRGDAQGGLYPLAEVYRMPTRAHPDELLTFLSHLPPRSRQGAMVDCWLLRKLAAESARQHRMMLIAYCLFDRYGTVNGRLIAPTVPVVHRDPAGYVVGTGGKLLTERGAPTRRATHRRAVQTGARERNPEADRYPWLEGRDVILAAHPTVSETPAGRRKQRERTRATAQTLRDAGYLDFETKYRTPPHGGPRELVALRLLPSAAHVEAHKGRWAARKHGAR